MAVSPILCVLITCFICVHAAALRGKASLCRDPDSGKFYTINATWSSSTFCGNYTCKQRRVSGEKNVLIRQYNVTNMKNNMMMNNGKLNDEKSNINKQHILDMFDDILINDKKQINKLNDNYDDDRLLTKKEIESLTDVLRTVKKSDLDAIVDIYSLAQKVYNEVDGNKNESTEKKISHEVKERGMPNKPVSYFYDPEKEIIDSDIDTIHIGGYEANNNKTGATANKYTMLDDEIHSFLNQRPPKRDKEPNFRTTDDKIGQTSYYDKPNIHIVDESIVSNTKMNGKEIEPSYLLPYPFTHLHHYNYSDPSNIFFSPWLWDYYHRRNYKSYINAILSDIPKTVLVNRFIDKISNEGAVPAKNSRHSYSLGPLIENINIGNRGYKQAFPSKKRVKVARVFKMSDERFKREINVVDENEEYETYIEKTTCITPLVPGYFSFGNMSQPYPHCCPQLIEKR